LAIVRAPSTPNNSIPHQVSLLPIQAPSHEQRTIETDEADAGGRDERRLAVMAILATRRNRGKNTSRQANIAELIRSIAANRSKST
jgi:hypothetical protein